MVRIRVAGKGPGDCGQWGLGSRNRRGPGVSPIHGLRGRGTSPGSPACSPGLSGQGNRPLLLSCSYWRAPPTCLSCSRFGLLPMPPGPMPLGGRGGPWRAGDWSGSSAGSPFLWVRQLPSAPLLLLPEGPSHLPRLISLALGAPILSGLHFSPLQSPHVLPVHLGVPPV